MRPLYFGRPVLGALDQKRGRAIAVHRTRVREIAQDSLPATASYEHVVGFDVTMQNAVPVQFEHAPQHIGADPVTEAGPSAEWARIRPRRQLEQVAPVYVFKKRKPGGITGRASSKWSGCGPPGSGAPPGATTAQTASANGWSST